MKTLDEQFFVNNEEYKVSSINDVLQSGEKILWQQSPKKRTFVLKACIKFLPVAIIWAIIDTFAIIEMIRTAFSLEFLYFIIPFFLIHLMPVWICITSAVKGFVKVKYINYVITTKRIIVIDGKEMFVSNDIKLKDITSCKTSQSFLGKLSNVYDITIQADNNVIVFSDIKNAKYVCKKINEIIENNAKKDNSTTTCEYCGSIIDKSKNQCKYCGATRKE